MANPVLGKFNQPTSLAQLTRGRGWNSELAGFLLPMARQDYVYLEYDFIETAVGDDPNAMWTVGNSGGASAASYTKTAASENGIIGADTGTTDNGGCSIIFDEVCFDAANKPGMHVRMKTDIVLGSANEISFSDAFTDANLPGVTDIDVPTVANGATDGVFVTYDKDTTINKAVALVGVGTSTTAAATTFGTEVTPARGTTTTTDTTLVDTSRNWVTSALINSVVTSNSKYAVVTANTATTLTVASWSGAGNPGNGKAYTIDHFPFVLNTYYDVVLQCYVAKGYSILNHNAAFAAVVASGPDTAVKMAPKIVTVTRSGTAVFPSIDFIRLWEERA